MTITPETGDNGYFKITVTNPNPTGIRSIDLSPESVNAEIEVLEIEEDTDAVWYDTSPSPVAAINLN